MTTVLCLRFWRMSICHTSLYHQVTSSGEDGRARPGYFSLEPSEAEMHH